MTLDEAIKRYTGNAKFERTHGNLQGCLEFGQLVEWLKELKENKDVLGKIRAEIEQFGTSLTDIEVSPWVEVMAKEEVLRIIDKYRQKRS